MSRSVALDNIHLKNPARWAHTEYSLDYHLHYRQKKTGLPPHQPEGMRRFYDLCGLDLLWYTNDGLHKNWQDRGRATDMGHAAYGAGGTDMRRAAESPFTSPEEVWAFDAVAEYGLPDLDEQARMYERVWREEQEKYPNQLVTGGYYKTIVSGAIKAFGWEALLVGASDMAKFEKVLDSFFRFTLHHMRAWAQTGAEVIIQHDDFVWTAGPFMHPDIYRKIIIPRYVELWKPLHAAGKKVLFCSDGTYTMFMEDIIAAGADGLIFEPTNDFRFVAERFAGTVALIGSAVDCRDMTFRSWEVVQESIDRTLELIKEAPGFVFAVGNHLPANIPEEMLEKYFNYLLPRLERRDMFIK
ncbi:MAG TPA: hypothetical protein GXX29_07340 [Firmicutes bacterium]|nr:hypothetical protein [Bacillota bacterium]